MVIWSSYSESFYISLREHDTGDRHKDSCYNRDFLRHAVESSPFVTFVRYNSPTLSSTSSEVDALSSILGNTLSQELAYTLTDRFNHQSSVLYKSTDYASTKRINSFYGLSGNTNKSIYALSYENSNYASCNLSKFRNRGIYLKNFVRILEQEVVNSLDAIDLYDEKNVQERRKIIIKPCGPLNAGIHGLEIQVDSDPSNLYIDCIERFKVYPSPFFHKENDRKTDYISDSNLDAFTNSNGAGTAKPYEYMHSTNTTYTDFDILEIKSDNKNPLSSILYTRNYFGLFIGRYHYKDDGWKFEQLSSKSYSCNDNVFYMVVSPYVSGECLFLKSTNSVALYDASISKEYHTVPLSDHIDKEKDLIQTACYMDSNNVIFGGSRLYHFDFRANHMDPLILQPSSNITVTNSAWTERHYHSSKHPLKHFTHLLSGPSCSFSNYWRISKPNYWSSFTACQTHPSHSHIFACIYSTSNCIYLFDLRTPIAPILEIPLPSTGYIGARFRHLVWSKHNKNGNENMEYTVLLAFCWKQKNPVCCEFIIDPSCSRFSCKPPSSYSTKFETLENFNTRIVFRNSRPINVCNVDEKGEHTHFVSVGPLIETLDSYSKFPLHFPADSFLTSIFHGYLGASIVNIDNQSFRILFIYTMSGKLLCFDLHNRNIILKNTIHAKGVTTLEHGQLDLANCGDLESGFEGFVCVSAPETDLSLPNDLIFDRIIKHVRVGSVVNDKKLDGVLDKLSKKPAENRDRSNLDACSSYPNYTFLNDFKTLIFYPKKILNSLLSHKETIEEPPNTCSIMPLTRLEKFFGDANMSGDDIVNVWNSNGLSIDYDYDEECIVENNPFVTSTPSCSCSLLSEQFFPGNIDHMIALLSSCKAYTSYKSNNMDLLPNESENHEMKSTVLQHCLTESRDRIMVTPSGAGSVGNAVLFHSPILPNFVSKSKTNVTHAHTNRCGARNLISVKLKDTTNSVDKRTIDDTEDAKIKIAQLTNLWRLVPNHEIIQNNEDQIIRRYNKCSNQIEMLKKSKEEQDRVIASLLQRTGRKS